MIKIWKVVKAHRLTMSFSVELFILIEQKQKKNLEKHMKSFKSWTSPISGEWAAGPETHITIKKHW